MNVIQLRSFVMSAHVGTFTHAAERLNISQPAISGHIRKLEEELGVQLFERSHRKVVPSEQGQTLLAHAERVLLEMDQFLSTAKTIARNPIRTMRIGFVVSSDVVRMVPLLQRVSRNIPHVRIDVAQGLSGWVAEGVKAGRFDAGFFLGPVPPPGLRAVKLDKLSYLLCMPTSWYRDDKEMTPTVLAQMPWVWAPNQASYPSMVSEMFSRYGITPCRFIEADREATIADFVASNIGVAILREPIARRSAAEGRVKIVKGYRAHTQLFFLTRPERDSDIQHLTDSVAEVFR